MICGISNNDVNLSIYALSNLELESSYATLDLLLSVCISTMISCPICLYLSLL